MAKVKLIPFRILNISNKAQHEIPGGVRMLNAPAVWPRATGSKTCIGIADTGCDYNHPDLAGAVVAGRNFVRGRSSRDFRDDHGHGTHVAGIIAARLNGSGVAGVAPGAKLVIAKCLNANGWGTTFGVARAVRWLTDWRGRRGERVRVINMSLGSPYDSRRLHAAIKYAVSKNVLVVCAAGNEGDGDPGTEEDSYPGAYPEVVEVGAIDLYGQPASFTNSNAQLDLAAPGVEIESTWLGGKYAILSGTSMATPHVSGAAALCIELDEADYGRRLTEPEVFALLIKRARDLGQPKTLVGAGVPYFDIPTSKSAPAPASGNVQDSMG